MNHGKIVLTNHFLIDGKTIETDKRDPEYHKTDVTKLHLWSGNVFLSINNLYFATVSDGDVYFGKLGLTAGPCRALLVISQ